MDLLLLLRCFLAGHVVVGVLGLNTKDYGLIVDDIMTLIENVEGEIGQFVRLSWHDAGTYTEELGIGGSRACQRFRPGGEYDDPANAGLQIPVDLQQPIHDRHSGKIDYADLWALTAVTSIKSGDGPEIPYHFGRKDCASIDEAVLGVLPEANSLDLDPPVNQLDHLRSVFQRMGFDDRGLVALSGAHVLGAAHTQFSGYDGPWTKSPTIFSNQFFVDLLTKPWPLTTLPGSNLTQAFTPDEEDDTMMLLSDLAITDERLMFQMCMDYAADQELFFQHFTHYFNMLQEGGHDALYEITDVAYEEDFVNFISKNWHWSSDAVSISETEGGFGTLGCVVISSSPAVSAEGGLVEGEHDKGATEEEFKTQILAAPKARYELDNVVMSESVEFTIWFSGSAPDDDSGDQYVGVRIGDERKDFLDISISDGQFAVSDHPLWIHFQPRQWHRVFVKFDWLAQTADISVTQEGEAKGRTASNVPFTENPSGVLSVSFVNSWEGETAKFDGLVIADVKREAPPVDRTITFLDPVLPEIPAFEESEIEHYINGDRVLGWTLQYSNSYDDVRIKPNDSLIFDYGTNHNVWRFDNLNDLEQCDIEQGVLVGSNNDGQALMYNVPIEDSGRTFGIACGTIGHCDGGMKFVVTVGGDTVRITSTFLGPTETIAIVVSASVVILLGMYICYRQRTRNVFDGMSLDTSDDIEYVTEKPIMKLEGNLQVHPGS